MPEIAAQMQRGHVRSFFVACLSSPVPGRTDVRGSRAAAIQSGGEPQGGADGGTSLRQIRELETKMCSLFTHRFG